MQYRNFYKLRLVISLILFFSRAVYCFPQAEHEIQVYASPTIQKKVTIFELHSNYTFNGIKDLPEPRLARYLNASLEVTHGISENFEFGFYAFSSLKPDGKYEYLGSHIRPRVSIPQKWNWPFDASLSVEFGFFRTDTEQDFFWEGEIRPIIDKTFGKLYFSFNPNIGFILNGLDKHWGFSPQLKGVYTFKEKVGVGIEYYSSIGTFQKLWPLSEQEHLLGPMIDLYLDPKWEFNSGFLFGLTRASNQQILKIVIGRRIGL